MINAKKDFYFFKDKLELNSCFFRWIMIIRNSKKKIKKFVTGYLKIYFRQSQLLKLTKLLSSIDIFSEYEHKL